MLCGHSYAGMIVSEASAGNDYPALGEQRMSALSDVPTGLGWKEHHSTYVVTLDDQIISPELQRTMAAHADEVVEIDAGHLPMLSQSKAVADVLADAAEG